MLTPPVSKGKDGISMKWFPNGPKVSTIPLPIRNSAHPWGSSNCSKCPRFCAGHYLGPEEVIELTVAGTGTPMCQPPSAILKDFYM